MHFLSFRNLVLFLSLGFFLVSCGGRSRGLVPKPTQAADENNSNIPEVSLPVPNPSFFVVTNTQPTQLDLSWVSEGGSTVSFAIAYQVGATAPASCSGASLSVSAISGLSRSISGLSASTQYSFRLCAQNSAGEFSSGVTLTATTAQVINPVPNPSFFVVTNTQPTQVDLSWLSGGGSTVSFAIAYQVGATAPTSCSGVSLSAISGLSRSISGLSASTQYSFRLCAQNSAGEFSSGVTLTATTAQVINPVPNPSNFRATNTQPTQLDLSWLSGGGSTVSFAIAYQVGATAPASCSGASLSVAAISGLSRSISGLSASTQYSFRLCAQNSAGEFSSGVTLTASTSEAAPSTPVACASGVTLTKGRVDMVQQSGKVFLGGWACEVERDESIPVDIYLGGPAGQGGTFVKRIVANISSEAAVGTQCSTQLGSHRFWVEITNEATANSGKAVYAYGISSNTPCDNYVLSNSGFNTP